VTPDDAREFLALAARTGIRPVVEERPLEDANQALIELRTKPVRGARVLRVSSR
jgi:propanol-preferring alcohol dehydrogenase